jgi:hypothetical protein
MIPIWVIYQRPSDYPAAAFAMREHHINGKGEKRSVTPTEHIHTAETIEELRQKVPPGKQRIPRSETDEPQIVEWYF